MGTWISHLRVAEAVLVQIPDLDEVTFAYGSLAPDSGIPNADWSAFDPPKEVTHFLQQGEGEGEIRDLAYYREYLASIDPAGDRKLYSFRLGYFFHLICDMLWSKCIGRATQAAFEQELEADRGQAWSNIKNDWYGLDQVFVRAHTGCLFWRVIVPEPNPPSYLPFIDEAALHHQFDYIRGFYSRPENSWFVQRPFPYMNETTMSRIVADSLAAVLTVHARLGSVGIIDSLQSSAGLLPAGALLPYEMPLGDVL